MRNLRVCILITVFLFLGAVNFSSCFYSYPEEKVIESLKEICRKEYGISNIEVKIKGDTIGVYLPLRQLFSTDFESLLASGKVKNLESLLQFSPDALDKVEDVLFSMSRVILSSGKKFNFYVLKACDTELTGLSLILIGYVQDIKRVRFWDIARSEYRKRVYHDLTVNYPVLWERPVRKLFSAIAAKKGAKRILDNFFVPESNFLTVTPFFYSQLLESEFKLDESYTFLDIRSIRTPENEVLVYVKTLETFIPDEEHGDYQFLVPSGEVLEYIFILEKDKIKRVISFQYIAEDGTVKRLEFPDEKELYDSIALWRTTFDIEDIDLEDFVARQMARRAQVILNMDKRIRTTFEQAQLDCIYGSEGTQEKPEEPSAEELVSEPPHFTFIMGLMLKRPILLTPTLMREDADIVYLLDKILRESVLTLRGYKEVPWDYIAIQRFGEGAPDFILNKEDLKLYRHNKISIEELLARAEEHIFS